MRYSPAELVSKVRVRFVSVLDTDTWAPGTAAPVASVAWPYIVDEVICALKRAHERMASRQKRNTTLNFPRICFSYQSAGTSARDRCRWSPPGSNRRATQFEGL